jgi:hypothetical protein
MINRAYSGAFTMANEILQVVPSSHTPHIWHVNRSLDPYHDEPYLELTSPIIMHGIQILQSCKGIVASYMPRHDIWSISNFDQNPTLC